MAYDVEEVYAVIHSVSNGQPVSIALNRYRLKQKIPVQKFRSPVSHAKVSSCCAVEGYVTFGWVRDCKEILGDYLSVAHNN